MCIYVVSLSTSICVDCLSNHFISHRAQIFTLVGDIDIEDRIIDSIESQDE